MTAIRPVPEKKIYELMAQFHIPFADLSAAGLEHGEQRVELGLAQLHLLNSF
jgi:hypothetical protein